MNGERPVWRGVLVIVLSGTALGVAHNMVGLASQPPRGIAWFAARATLPSLEGFVVPDSGAAMGGGDSTASSEAPEDARSPVPAQETPPSRAQDVKSAPVADRAASPGTRAPVAGAAPVSIPEMDHAVEVDLAMTKRLFDSGAALFLDARDPPEYDAGHIPGALRLTRNDVLAEPERLRDLPARGRPIVAYCGGGACEASLDLARTLVEAGFRKVLVFTGGMPEWTAAGHPIERGGGGP